MSTYERRILAATAELAEYRMSGSTKFKNAEEWHNVNDDEMACNLLKDDARAFATFRIKFIPGTDQIARSYVDLNSLAHHLVIRADERPVSERTVLANDNPGNTAEIVEADGDHYATRYSI